jgi:peptidoglycan/xylan/chitin deacetylase (PgdA/CDA1 family)
MFSLTVMMYHYVRDAGDNAQGGSGVPGMPVATFHAQLDALAREYEIVTWDDVRAAVLGTHELPARACLLTFDDGVCDHYLNVYPALKERGLSGLFFALPPPGDRHAAEASLDSGGLILAHKLHYLLACLGLERLRRVVCKCLTTAQRERFVKAEAGYRQRWSNQVDVFKSVLQRDLEHEVNPLLSKLLEAYVGPEAELARRLYLNWDQIREMRAGDMHFGGHSRTHPWFDFVAADRREMEIRDSHAWLGAVEEGPFAFAYPYGGLAVDAPTRLAQNGFCAAFTTHSGTAQHDPFYIGRFDGEEWNLGSALE